MEVSLSPAVDPMAVHYCATSWIVARTLCTYFGGYNLTRLRASGPRRPRERASRVLISAKESR